jgi:hypothetical protein
LSDHATSPTCTSPLARKVTFAGFVNARPAGSISTGVVTLEVPAGALDQEVEIVVRELAGAPAGFEALSPQYAFEPPPGPILARACGAPPLKPSPAESPPQLITIPAIVAKESATPPKVVLFIFPPKLHEPHWCRR